MKTLYLYKYLPVSTRTLGIIDTRKIWYAKPAGFNDPFDCGLDLCDDMKIEEKIQVLRVQMERQGWSARKITEQLEHSFTPKGELNDTAANNILKLTAAIYKNRDNTGVLSLSRTCKSILMWSHYATEHRGICIEFAVPMSDSLHKVTYSAIVPRYTLHDIFVERNSEILLLFTTKHTHWRYEKEYRIILDRGDILHDIPGRITSIIFGLKTLPDDESIVRKVASGLKGVRFRKCGRIENKFSIKMEHA